MLLGTACFKQIAYLNNLFKTLQESVFHSILLAYVKNPINITQGLFWNN
jgi:hypothetical protein